MPICTLLPFHHPPMSIPSITVVQSSPTEIKLNFEMSIVNPSSINFTSVNFPFRIYYENVEIGNSTITPFHLASSSHNSLNATTFFNINNITSQPIQDFFNHYSNNDIITLQIVGNPDACPISYLKEALSKLNTTAQVNGLTNQDLISFLHLHFDPTNKDSSF